MINKFLNIVEWIILGIISIILIFMLSLRVFGFEYYSVVSWSMGDEIPIGSFVCINKTDETEAKDKIQLGDVVICKSETMDIPLMHKVIEVNDNNIVLHGVANSEGINETFSYDEVLGIVAFSIPFLGYITNLINNVMFWVILALVVLAYFIFKEIIKTISKKNNN